MATGETGFEDVFYDLISVQYHSLKAGHDYGQYVRDAENANLDDIAAFFREVMEQDSARAKRCHDLLGKLQGTPHGGPATPVDGAEGAPGRTAARWARDQDAADPLVRPDDAGHRSADGRRLRR